MSGDGFGWLWQCARCPRAGFLLIPTNNGERLCGPCWRRAGWPNLTAAGSMAQVHAAESAIRTSMGKRGGADRHLLNKGAT